MCMQASLLASAALTAEVGTLKQTLKDAVLDNKVPNEREPLMQLLMRKAEQMGLTVG